MSNPGEENPPPNYQENPPPNQQNPPLNQQNSQPNQQIPQPDDEATSRPRRRARDPCNPQLTLAIGPRTLTRPPTQISWEHLQGALGPMPQQVPQLRQRTPSRALLLPPSLGLNYDWKCAICRAGFLNMRGLSGHMRVHKDRNWKGIHPPPELCKPQGLGVIADLYSKKDYDPLKRDDRMLPGLLSLGGGVTVGGGGGVMSQSIVPWVPPHNPNYQGELGSGGDGSKEDRSLGKRPVWAREEARSNEPLRRSKRSRVGNVPDLNVTPPQHNEPEVDDQARAENETPLDDQPVPEVEKGEGSSAPLAETKVQEDAREDASQAEPKDVQEAREDASQAEPVDVQEAREDAPEAVEELGEDTSQVEPVDVQEAREDAPEAVEELGEDAPHAEPEAIEKVREDAPQAEPEAIEKVREDAPQAEPEAIEKVREDAPQAEPKAIEKVREDAPQAEPMPQEEVVEGDNAPEYESAHEEEGTEEVNALLNGPEPNEEAKEEGSNAQCNGAEKEGDQGDDE